MAIDLSEFVLGFLYDSVCSPILGLAVGILAAVIFKWVDMRTTKLLELCLFVLIMYVPFLIAEMLGLSGIVTILFTGMAARAYVVPNVSEDTASNANTLFRLAAHLAETSIFLELGLSVFGMKGSVYGAFIGWSLLACLIGRALNVYPLVYLYNSRFRKQQSGHEQLDNRNENIHNSHVDASSAPNDSDEVELTNVASRSHDSMDSASHSASLECPDSHDSTEISHFRGMVQHDLDISSSTAHMLWFSGLRGAVAYACVRSFPNTFHHAEIFTVTTMCIVLATVFGLGGTTEAALNLLGIEINVDEGLYMEAWHQEQSEDGLILRIEDQLKHYAVRSSTQIALNTHDDHGVTMAPGEASIASGFRHHDDDGHVVDNDAVVPNRPPQRRESVYDYGNR